MIVALKFFPIVALIVSVTSILYALIKKPKVTVVLNCLMVVILVANIVALWVTLDRPPMRTLGETRLWYSFFLPMLGLIIYRKIDSLWIVLYSSGMGALFLLLNVINPDNFDKTLMPALQSIWFVPHVIVYILSYALLGVSSLYAFWALYKYFIKKEDLFEKTLKIIHPFVQSGIVLLTLGLLFGALWAKEAWGHYWTWDPKETWALITWLSYLNYLHACSNKYRNTKLAVIFLAFNFVLVLLCWFGVNYMPSASNSVHTYTQ